jgi:hypothetical protein
MQLLNKRTEGNFMVDSTGSKFEPYQEYGKRQSTNAPLDAHVFVAQPHRIVEEFSSYIPTKMPTYVHLAIEELQCFEVLENQFSQWGVTFNNAIALIPSNPSFVLAPDSVVIMGAPKSGLIELNFKYPVSLVSGSVTSSRRTVLSAFDKEGNLITQSEIPAANLVGSNYAPISDTHLTVTAPQIYQASFYAFDGQLVINNLSFGFATYH